MPSEEKYVEFVTTHIFESSAEKLLTEEDRRELELLLAADPRRGQCIERTGVFVSCVSLAPVGGKARAEVRASFYYIDPKDRVYLIEVYAKGVKDDLTRAEENELRAIARVLDGEE